MQGLELCFDYFLRCKFCGNTIYSSDLKSGHSPDCKSFGMMKLLEKDNIKDVLEMINKNTVSDFVDHISKHEWGEKK